MYPIRLDSFHKPYVWGSESWEVSDRKEGMSLIANGKWEGKTLHEFLEDGKEKVVGKNKCWNPFPLLVKIIDAKENLSLQVHPDATSAPRLGGEAKSEMWIALKKSTVYVGLRGGVTLAEFTKALEQKRAEPLLNRLDLERGDAIYVPAGMVHAICKDSHLLEVQQNSNTTYRLYDWGRSGRQMHLEEGLSCIDWNSQQACKIEPNFVQADGHHRVEGLVSNEHFIVERLEILDRWQIKSHTKSCQILYCVRGEAMIEDERVGEGQTYLIPAGLPQVSITGHCQLINIRLP